MKRRLYLWGHRVVPAGDNVLIIYNDDVGNIAKRPEDKKVEIFKTKDAVVTVQEIDPLGKVKKYRFTKNKELEGAALVFDSFSKIEDGLYFANTLYFKNKFSVTGRTLTFQVN